jgi:hypothetical protein
MTREQAMWNGVHVGGEAYSCGCGQCSADDAALNESPESFVTTNRKWGASGVLGTDGGVVTWSLAGAGLTNQTGSGFFTGTTVDLSAFLNFDYLAVLRQAFDLWSAVANVEFIQITDGGGNIGVGNQASIRVSGGFIDGSSQVLARAFFPPTGGDSNAVAAHGDMVFDSGETTFWTANSFLLVAAHEIGHALGLDHENVNLALMNPSYNPSLTGLQADDIAGIQAIYGSQDFGPNVYTMSASLANLTLLDGAPNLTVVGNALGNTIVGSDGAESIDGGAGANALYGRGGNDFLTAVANFNVAFGDEGNDQLFFQGNQNQLFGGNGNDWVGVNGTNNALVGGDGDEVWIGATGNSNTLDGQGGHDALFANGTGNNLYGSAGNDWLGCSGTSNTLLGGAGSEWMGVSGGSNAANGGEGNDTLLSVGSNILYGENGDDWLGCSGNNNYMAGMAGNDYVAATGNNNTLDGGTGNDVLVAGAGHTGCLFVFKPGHGQDRIEGFLAGNAATDVIDLRGFGLTMTSLMNTYATDVGGNVVIALSGSDILTIAGVTKAELTAGDFLLV